MAKTNARGIHRLTAIEVREAKADLDDGGGLVLRVKPNGAAWTWRFTAPNGKRREMGFGVCHRQSLKHAGASLDAARTLADKARDLLKRSIDPLAARQEARTNAKAEEARAKEEASTKREVEHWTLARCARDYHARVIERKLTAKHAAQWIASLENHIPPKLWHAPIVTIRAPQLVAALLAIKAH